MLYLEGFAQALPNYIEREGILADSTNKLTNYNQDVVSQATEGFIEADEYFVGPGDELLISILGVEDKGFKTVIDHEGNIFIPKVGVIELRNLNLAEAKRKIRESILKSYKNVEVAISLISFRKIKVSLIGNIKRSGTMTLPSNYRLSDIILNTNLLLKDSDIRNILIKNRQKKNQSYDLLKFLRLGSETENPYLREGDIIKIPKADRVVSIFGEVPYPGTHEYVENQTVSELIELAGGLLHTAVKDTIEVIRFEQDNKTQVSEYYSLSEIQDKNIYLGKSDKVVVREKPNYLIDRLVEVNGFVKYPGLYKIKKNKTTLKELVENEVGGFLQEASLEDAYVIRTIGIDKKDTEFERLKNVSRSEMTEDEYDYFKARSREVRGKMVIDFERLFKQNDETEDIVLKRGDKIFVPEKQDYITMVGQVVTPGNIKYKKNFNVEDYIELAGGFAWRAEDGDVRVIKDETGEWIEADDVENLNPGDIIWVPEEPPAPKFWDVFKDVMAILGQSAAIVTSIVAVISASRN